VALLPPPALPLPGLPVLPVPPLPPPGFYRPSAIVTYRTGPAVGRSLPPPGRQLAVTGGAIWRPMMALIDMKGFPGAVFFLSSIHSFF